MPATKEIPTDETTTEAYMQSLDDQVKAAREWLNANACSRTGSASSADSVIARPQSTTRLAGAPTSRRPSRSRTSSACRVVSGLCRDVHVLRTLVVQEDPSERARMLASPKDREITEAAPGEVFDFIAISAAPRLSRAPSSPSASRPRSARPTGGRSSSRPRSSRRRTWSASTPTPMARYLEYVTAFAAGAGATFAASWKLLPWYSSYKPTTAPASSA